MNAETPKEFGEELRRERELRDVSREQLAEVTKVSSRQIEALETGRFDQLPARVFSRGFVRSIALYLGLDPDRTAAAFSHVHETWTAAEAARREERTSSGTFVRLSRPRRTVSLNTTVLGLGVAAVLALLTGAAALWKSRGTDSKSAARRPGVIAQREPVSGPASLSLPPAVAAATVALAPAIVPPAPPRSDREPSAAAESGESGATGQAGATAAQGATSGRTLTLTFRDDCWTEVSIDGRVAVAELCRKGSVREFSGAKRFVLTLGNAGGVDVAINGRAIPALGQVGQVVRNLVLDETGRDGTPEGS